MVTVDEEYVDLLGLQTALREGIEELFPDTVWLTAEVAQLQERANGHCYLDLVQMQNGKQVAKARAAIWRSRWPFLSEFYRQATGSPLAAGQQVLVEAEVSYSEIYGLTLVIDDINPEFTLGDAERRRRETIAKLEAEGLLDRQQQLQMPLLPYRLAVISAADAAGYGDFCRHLSDNGRGYAFDVHLFPATMQGQGAPESICDALAQIDCAEPAFDAALIIRGGGSNLDLACFDDYGLAFTVANFAIPVLTAIGHERDTHVADLVAWRHLKTPTALADEFIDMYMAEDARIESLQNRLRLAIGGRLAALETRVEVLGARIRQALAGKIMLESARVDRLEKAILSADPRQVLQRGYTLATDSRGVVQRSVASFAQGDEIQILMSDGRLTALVLEIQQTQ